MHYEPHFLVGCGFDKKVYHIDPRAATVLAEKRYHKKAVLCVKADDKYILTGSEDSTVVVYDRRADKIFDTLKVSPRSTAVFTSDVVETSKSETETCPSETEIETEHTETETKLSETETFRIRDWDRDLVQDKDEWTAHVAKGPWHQQFSDNRS